MGGWLLARLGMGKVEINPKVIVDVPVAEAIGVIVLKPEAIDMLCRAAMIGFFMAYFVDSLTGVGLVDQMGNFFCKTLLFIAVSGVLLIRKNEDIDNLKKLIDETTFYDKQWQATWQDENSSTPKKE
ncbi:hypothetical protein RIF29_18239 [Crotalaria pallida]|uniref:Uncharacterized protein n=1 Tax=Crotalaria pallida TaxID=3830 RepID=A0AAN9IG14_CROPI